MANRTIQFCGYAYGAAPVQLNAHINGQLVFSGTVDTLNETIPSEQVDTANAPVLFSVTESVLFPTSFSGSYPMTVSVATGYGIIICQTNSNYMTAGGPDGPFTPGNATTFLSCFTGTPTNSEGTLDSRSSVQINGIAQVPPLTPSSGQWAWQVDAGSTLECNFNVSIGSE